MKPDWLSLKDITIMVKRHNKMYKNNKIKIGKKVDMYNTLLKGGNLCTTVSCSKKFNIDKSYKPESYKPIQVSPKTLKKGAWLSSYDIDSVMNYYHEQYPSFDYIGTLPIDFQNIYPEIFNMKFKYGTYGAIFNTDPSWKTGEHWFALYIDTNEKIICVFDSNGDNPPSQIKQFIKNIDKDNTWNIFINKKQHQFTDGPCGLFALNFIIERVTNNKSCKTLFNDSKINDKTMEKFRCKLFTK